MMKKTVVAWLVVLACAGGPLWGGGVEEQSAAGDGAETTAHVSYFFKDYGRYPLDPEKHIVFRELGKKFNIEWDLSSAPGSEYDSKLSVILASGDIPDIMLLVNQGNSRVAQWGDVDGYFLDLGPHLAKMPHLLSNFLSVIPDGIKNSMTDTGAIYSTGNYKTSTADNFSQGFSYRKDIFDKHGMTPGNTFDAFYENLKQLKTLYPDTSPFSVPGGSDWLITYSSPLFETGIGYGGKPVLPTGVYYDFWGTPPRYAEGGTGENYRTMLQFLHRLYAEGSAASGILGNGQCDLPEAHREQPDIHGDEQVLEYAGYRYQSGPQGERQSRLHLDVGRVSLLRGCRNDLYVWWRQLWCAAGGQCHHQAP